MCIYRPRANARTSRVSGSSETTTCITAHWRHECQHLPAQHCLHFEHVLYILKLDMDMVIVNVYSYNKLYGTPPPPPPPRGCTVWPQPALPFHDRIPNWGDNHMYRLIYGIKYNAFFINAFNILK